MFFVVSDFISNSNGSKTTNPPAEDLTAGANEACVSC